MRLIYKAVVRVSQFRFLVTSVGFIPIKTTKVYEENAELFTSITANNIAPRLRHVDLLLTFIHCEHTKEVFQVAQTQSRTQISNIGTKP